MIRKNNANENRSRIEHEYKVGDLVCYKNLTLSKYGDNPWSGPHEVTKVNDNGTIRIQQGIVNHLANIRLIKPYKS